MLVFFFIFSLAVELLILFAFRKSDTNSRSLDRMRKYFESKTRELDDLVGEKKLELDDIKKAMEGSEQNARDLIKSFESSFNMVRKRDEEIKVLSSQLDTFRSAFNDMADASLKADKNLQLLKQESRNVEIVRRSIQNLTSQLGEIKEQSDSILTEFNKKNEEAFEQLRLNLLNTVNLNMGSLQDGLEMAGKRLDTFNTQIEELTGRQALVSENAVKDLTIAMNTRLDSFKGGFAHLSGWDACKAGSGAPYFTIGLSTLEGMRLEQMYKRIGYEGFELVKAVHDTWMESQFTSGPRPELFDPIFDSPLFGTLDRQALESF